MIIIYRILTIVIVIFLPLILVWRVFKKKEILNRSKEKICFFNKKKIKEDLFGFMVQVLVK